MATKPISDAMSVTEIRANFSQVVNEVYREGHRVVVEKDGIPVAAIVTRSDLQYLQARDVERLAAWQKLNELRGTLPETSDEELMSEALNAIREVREDRDRERLASSPGNG